MTLSAIGDAETPAGGSVCIRFPTSQPHDEVIVQYGSRVVDISLDLSVTIP